MVERGGRTRLRAAAPAPAPEVPADGLANPELYLNRELAWLAFNERVLNQAEDARVPLLERIKFLAISASNLDEFFMKRIGGLKQQVVAGLQERTVDGRTPQEQIAAAYAIVRDFERRQRQLWNHLRDQLRDEHGIQIQAHAELASDEQAALRERYVRNIFPLVTPLALDPAHPFPFISNLSINLLVGGHHPKESEPLLIRVKVPVGSGIPRFIPVGDSRRFVPLEDVIAQHLDLLLPGMAVASCESFRVTRNANTERDEEEADDLLAMIESELRDRRFAPMVRLEVAAGMQSSHRGMLAAELGLDEHADVADVDGLLALRDLMEIAQLDDATLHDPPHHPIDHPRLAPSRNIFHILRDAGALLLQHPYESFSTSVERLVREASEDPKVRAIKMTLYRTSADSNIIEYLRVAARNGKQVAVVIELKARFDEAANIRFATQLEEDGIHVTYGVVGLKTHCKVILVVRQDYNGLRRYVHIGTGNYHAGTARIYADYGLLSSDEALGRDLTELFNYLTTGYRPKRAYAKILPAPTLLKDALLAKIERECEHRGAGQPALIQMKVNALEDADVTRALYRASQAGVQVDLIVRDTCRLRPGIAGLSERVRVVSIVGRFLEHGRIYYFRNGGAEEYFIGSADCMKRNLESRVEVVAPVEDPDLRAELRAVLDLQLAPSRDAWEMQSDGTYVRRTPEAESCQSIQIGMAERRQKEAGRLRKRRPKGFARRSSTP
ncbi:polyphosphate kinase 1 [bacterium]|nr:polyphosphate kinase 1 [bacterium]